MQPFLMAATTLIHGLFTSMVLLVLADVASPTFNVEEIPAWTGGQAVVVFVAVLAVSFALGIVLHTISRGLFHKQKQKWTLDVLASGAVENRLVSLSKVYPSPGGPSYAELWEEGEGTEGKHNQAWRARTAFSSPPGPVTSSRSTGRTTQPEKASSRHHHDIPVRVEPVPLVDRRAVRLHRSLVPAERRH